MSDTYGHDLAFACTLDAVNRQLKAGFAGSQATCTYSGTDTSEKVTIAVDAVFAPWQMTKGGSNKLLRFSVPFSSGSMTITGSVFGAGGQRFDLASVAVEVEIQLGWLGSGTAAPGGCGAQRSLAFNLVTKGTHIGDTTPGAVTPVSVSDPAKHLSDVAAAVLEDVIAELLIANKAKLNYVFATIEPTPPGGASWLAPVRWDYYYQEPDKGPAVLCVLSVLTDRALPAPAFDSSVLAAAGDVFMILSNAMFLEHGVLPGLPAVYGANCFKLVPTGTDTAVIQNTGSIPTRTTSWGADTYYPHIDGFQLSVSGGSVSTTVSGRCDITGLANAYVSFSGTKIAASVYDPQSGKISFSTPAGTITPVKNIPWYDWVFGVLSGGVGIAIIDSVVAAVTNTVTDAVGAAVSSTGDVALGQLVINACSWAGSTVTPVAGGLSGAFWLSGKAG